MKRGMSVSLIIVIGLLVGAAKGDVPVTVTGVTGHDGGNWPATLGHLSDMCNGNLSYDFGTGDHNPGMTVVDPADPATWTYAGNSWPQEWKANSRLDTNATLNAKIAAEQS